MGLFKETEKQREDFLRNIRFIDKSAFGADISNPEKSPKGQLQHAKRVQREYRHEIRREKGEMRILHFKLFLLGHERLSVFIQAVITGRQPH